MSGNVGTDAARQAAIEAARRRAQEARRREEARKRQQEQARRAQEQRKKAAAAAAKRAREQQRKAVEGMQRAAARKLGDSRKEGAIEKLILRTAVKKVSAQEARETAADLRADLGKARDAKDLAQLAGRARELQGRMSVTRGKGIDRSLQSKVRDVRDLAEQASAAYDRIDALERDLRAGSPAEKAAAAAGALARPERIRADMRALEGMAGSEAHGRAQQRIDAIAAAATPEMLARQLQRDPDPSSYGPDTLADLGRLRRYPDHPGLQKALDRVAERLITPPPAVPTLDDVKGNPGLARLIAPLGQNPDRQVRHSVRELVKDWGAQSLEAHLKANGAPGDPEGNADATIAGFGDDMRDLAKLGLGPAVESAAAEAVEEAAVRVAQGGVGVEAVENNPAYGQLLTAIKPEYRELVARAAAEWSTGLLARHLEGKEGEDGVRDAITGYQADMADLAQATGLGAQLDTAMRDTLTSEEAKDRFEDVGNKGKSIFQKGLDLVGGAIGSAIDDVLSNPLHTLNPVNIPLEVAGGAARLVGAEGVASTIDDVRDVSNKPLDLAAGLAVDVGMGALDLGGEALGLAGKALNEPLVAVGDAADFTLGTLGKAHAAPTRLGGDVVGSGLGAVGLEGAGEAVRDASRTVADIQEAAGDIAGDVTRSSLRGAGAALDGAGQSLKFLVQHPVEAAKGLATVGKAVFTGDTRTLAALGETMFDEGFRDPETGKIDIARGIAYTATNVALIAATGGGGAGAKGAAAAGSTGAKIAAEAGAAGARAGSRTALVARVQRTLGTLRSVKNADAPGAVSHVRRFGDDLTVDELARARNAPLARGMDLAAGAVAHPVATIQRGAAGARAAIDRLVHPLDTAKDLGRRAAGRLRDRAQHAGEQGRLVKGTVRQRANALREAAESPGQVADRAARAARRSKVAARAAAKQFARGVARRDPERLARAVQILTERTPVVTGLVKAAPVVVTAIGAVLNPLGFGTGKVAVALSRGVGKTTQVGQAALEGVSNLAQDGAQTES